MATTTEEKVKKTASKKTKDKKESKKKKLVIVESPAKAKTINRYLGSDYLVMSSMGHLIDLPRSRLAIDVDHGFEPEYITIRGRAKILNELKKEAKKAEEVLLAADDDREGESIAWHIGNKIRGVNSAVPIKRIVFHEITKDALKEAIDQPRDIDISKVNAQKARRVLDRLIGYNLSPLLWDKIKRGLSAGRVQNVALLIICNREDEIETFVPVEYWTFGVFLKHKNKEFLAELQKYKGEKPDLKTKQDVEDIMEHLKDKTYTVASIEVKDRLRNPTAPYTTSKLQQAASSALGYSASKTMQVAQSLYEGVDIAGEATGLITYMRTDSVRISPVAQEQAKEFIEKEYGSNYLPPEPPTYSVKKNAQDAHEAIRPTNVFLTPDSIKEYLKTDQYKLYKLIWERFVSSQMLPAKMKNTRAIIVAGDCEFSLSSSKIEFDGFMKVLTIDKEDKEKASKMPNLSKDDVCEFVENNPQQHFTTPPPRYTDASLVKILEESGIGRPSTYAPTIKTIISRHYVQRKGKQLVPTELGKLVNELISENFPELVNINFTADMESKLDKIEDDNIEWNNILKEFYPHFLDTLKTATENINNMKDFFNEETDFVCEKCGKKMIKRLGRYGYFIACSGFPECKNTKGISFGVCPKCGGDITLKRSKRGREFYGCSNYPKCDFVSWDKPLQEPCPKCGGLMVEKNIKNKGLFKVCIKEDCGYSEEIKEDEE
ncbi:type I DNA topoisomerase [Brachyspira hyodysenteriae]|uniref:type I DNA topoisomerase n=1 Tax=Brachyspira hyodysenteriae TaxID=159 RepID=UPI00063D9191|nr:type I DNA topoisomerase [Brachyspira hyodysenteriae]AUJ50761.1 DNA topoisomerase I [Brachyspira hyodysenteriae]KLI36943.1 DNA topoisomerase I [Brachyspira hyodysenteriae]KLI39731.1 DNA topoisomerase I [Brachyspira hyodysenteriae]KLI46331.1 DNA topoisomerase I [Brachyspira hyodysenteriae]KLI52745.1 DNA topoisomerase I [Brachyspira hyodysenteriae]